MRALAAAQRLELSLGAFADSLYSLTQVGATRGMGYQLHSKSMCRPVQQHRLAHPSELRMSMIDCAGQRSYGVLPGLEILTSG